MENAQELGWSHIGTFWQAGTTNYWAKISRKCFLPIFWPNQVQEEPNWGFLDVLEPLKPSIFHFEHCKALIFTL
jgi:hypothetical protein